MPQVREVDFVPEGDYAFCVLKPLARQRCALWFYDWDQCELDARFQEPTALVTMGQREMLQLAKYLLTQAGDPLGRKVNVPDKDWHQSGNQHTGEE